MNNVLRSGSWRIVVLTVLITGVAPGSHLDSSKAVALRTLEASSARPMSLIENDTMSRLISCAVSRKSQLVCWG